MTDPVFEPAQRPEIEALTPEEVEAIKTLLDDVRLFGRYKRAPRVRAAYDIVCALVEREESP